MTVDSKIMSKTWSFNYVHALLKPRQSNTFSCIAIVILYYSYFHAFIYAIPFLSEVSERHISGIRSILIHEYQHGSTLVNTNQHKSTRINTNLTRINTSPTRVNTNQHDSNTSQHKSTRVRHEFTRISTSLKQV